MIPTIENNPSSRQNCLIAYRRFENKEISLNDLLSELAYITIEFCLNDLKCQYHPTKPKELMDYEQLDYKEKKKVGDSFWREPAILAYQVEDTKVLRENTSNKYWLMQCLENLPKEDTANQYKIQEVIKTYGK